MWCVVMMMMSLINYSCLEAYRLAKFPKNSSIMYKFLSDSVHRQTNQPTANKQRQKQFWNVVKTLHRKCWLLLLNAVRHRSPLPVITVVMPAKWHCHLWTCYGITGSGSGGRFSPSVRPHNPATGFRPPLATMVSAEPFSHGTGTLRCLQKEMVTYRHWAMSLWRDPDDVPHCRILSPDKTEWRLISATLCGWRRCFVADQLWFMTRIREVEDGHVNRSYLLNRLVLRTLSLSLPVRCNFSLLSVKC